MKMHPVYKGTNTLAQLKQLLEAYDNVWVLTDNNTHKYCLPR
jgi:hypothetical protein